MKPLLTRLRSAFGVATAWAVVGAAFGFGLSLVAYLEGSGINTTPLWRAALYWGVAGFIGGGAFFAALATAYRDTRVQDLPRSRVALLGALAGMVFPLGLLGLVVLSGSRAYPPSPWWASWASLEDLGRLPPLGFSGSLEDRSLWLSPRRGPAKTLGWSAWSRAPRAARPYCPARRDVRTIHAVGFGASADST